MAHTKAGGSKAGQGGNVSGKRLGIKVYGGSPIKKGQIILNNGEEKLFRERMFIWEGFHIAFKNGWFGGVFLGK
jgi:hypothetical protein